MPLDSDDSTRCLRRNLNQNKSHLPKYSSLPEFRLVVKETSSYCRQCGFTGSVINPICLWCAWTCKEAQQHEFASSGPRARRASAPSKVFIKFDLSPWKFTVLTGDHANIDSNQPVAPLKQRELKATSSVLDPLPIVSSQPPYMPVDQTDATVMDLHQDYIDTNMVDDYAQQREVHTGPERLGDVATATHSSSTSSLLFAQSTSAMGLKLSRRTYNVGRTDKMPSFYPDDAHEHKHAINVSGSHDNDDELTPTPIKSAHPYSPKQQHSRPLRRKNHLHIMPCAPDPDTSEPIAISLTLHHSSPPNSSHLSKKSSQILRHSHTRAHSHPQSISTSGDPVTPVTPTYQRSPPPPPKTSPVRLGHPSRPYYTAIRKNCVSPPTPPRSRPQSQPPPPSFHLGIAPMTSTAAMINASRHLSMSAMPPTFSSLDDNDDNGDFEVLSGPTNSARLSLSSSRQSYDNRTQTHTRNAQSLSRAANGIISNNRSNGFGFSMSGETELRMALAASSPSGVATTTVGRPTTASGDGFRFRETVIPSQQNMNHNNRYAQNSSSITNTGTDDYLHTGHVGSSRDSFMGRVKKLRKGLKEMLKN